MLQDKLQVFVARFTETLAFVRFSAAYLYKLEDGFILRLPYTQ